VAPQRGGRFALLDARLATLKVFDRQGLPLAEHGRSGSGPGEFRVPTAMVAITADTVAVLDHSLSRISFFNTAMTKNAYVRSFQLEVPSRDFCLVKPWMFLASFRAKDTTMVRRIDFDGTELGAFGAPFPEGGTDLGLSRMVSLQAKIACFPTERLVLLASDWFPTIRAYDAESGSLRWTTNLSKFEQTDIEATGNGGVSFRPPKGLALHKVLAIVALEGGVALVQLERSWKDSPGPKAQVERQFEIRLLRTDTGKELGSQVGLPVALVSDGTTLFLSDTTDYPKVLRAEYAIKK